MVAGVDLNKAHAIAKREVPEPAPFILRVAEVSCRPEYLQQTRPLVPARPSVVSEVTRGTSRQDEKEGRRERKQSGGDQSDLSYSLIMTARNVRCA
jgi:hypothetical protein